MEFVWEKPVLIFYKERPKRERKAFAVVKARRLAISEVEEESTKFRGSIENFFPLMGDIDSISSAKGIADRYVLCWFEDKEGDFSKAWRRLNGVTFPAGVSFVTDERGKRTYNAKFEAEHGKLK